LEIVGNSNRSVRESNVTMPGTLDPAQSRFRFGKLVLIIPSRFGCWLNPCGYGDFDDDQAEGVSW
jgi:hypothetical protein